MKEVYQIRRLADESAFVVFNRNDWKTFIVLQEYLDSRLKEAAMIDTGKTFARRTKAEQIKILLTLNLLETQ